jgi:hypothetical protein
MRRVSTAIALAAAVGLLATALFADDFNASNGGHWK